jgi:hypothetical protein
LVFENLSKAFAFFSSSAMLLNFGLPAGPQPAPAPKKAELARIIYGPKNQQSAFSRATELPPGVSR